MPSINRTSEDEGISSGALRVNLHNKSPPTRSFNNAGDVKHVILARHDANALRWIRPELVKFLHKPTKHSWRNGLFANKTSANRAYAIELFYATYHDDEVESRRRGGVEGGERGLSVENAFGEPEPSGQAT